MGYHVRASFWLQLFTKFHHYMEISIRFANWPKLDFVIVLTWNIRSKNSFAIGFYSRRLWVKCRSFYVFTCLHFEHRKRLWKGMQLHATKEWQHAKFLLCQRRRHDNIFLRCGISAEMVISFHCVWWMLCLVLWFMSRPKSEWQVQIRCEKWKTPINEMEEKYPFSQYLFAVTNSTEALDMDTSRTSTIEQ